MLVFLKLPQHTTLVRNRNRNAARRLFYSEPNTKSLRHFSKSPEQVKWAIDWLCQTMTRCVDKSVQSSLDRRKCGIRNTAMRAVVLCQRYWAARIATSAIAGSTSTARDGHLGGAKSPDEPARHAQAMRTLPGNLVKGWNSTASDVPGRCVTVIRLRPPGIAPARLMDFFWSAERGVGDEFIFFLPARFARRCQRRRRMRRAEFTVSQIFSQVMDREPRNSARVRRLGLSRRNGTIEPSAHHGRACRPAWRLKRPAMKWISLRGSVKRPRGVPG